jgi:hypothetical protein
MAENIFTAARRRIRGRGELIDPDSIDQQAAAANVVGMSTFGAQVAKHFGFESKSGFVSLVYEKIAADVSSAEIRHVKVDEGGLARERVSSNLQTCLERWPNIDQSPSAFIQDVVLTMFDSGAAVLVPTKAETDEEVHTADGIYELRCCAPVPGGFTAQTVTVDFYSDQTGKRRRLTLPKTKVAIIENPFYHVMSEYNATLARLQSVAKHLDTVNSTNAGGKLNLLLQFPQPIRTDLQKDKAAAFLQQIANDLTTHPLGIATIGSDIRVIQLNRPIDSGLFEQMKYQTESLYAQLGLTSAVFDGTAKEEEQLAYKTRTIYPILDRITEELTRKFLTLTAYTKGQRFRWFTNQFELTTVGGLAELIDKALRNAALTPNEVRVLLGFMPIPGEDNDTLRNRNIAESNQVIDPERNTPVGDAPTLLQKGDSK